MKKLLLFLLLPLLALPLFASNGDTFNIGGVVPLILELTVTPTDPFDNLTLVGSTAPITVPIASIAITTNNSAGWELWITSVNVDAGNSCALYSDDGDQVDYTLTYAGTNGLATTAVAANPGTEYGSADNTDTAERYSDTGTLSIIYNQSTSYPAGYYADQLTVVLRAK
jgi:hypothetical protein